jgi:hypothetical protein
MQRAVHRMADKKNSRGLGKNEANMRCLSFARRR